MPSLWIHKEGTKSNHYSNQFFYRILTVCTGSVASIATDVKRQHSNATLHSHSLYICYCCSFCYCPFLINIKLGLFWTLPSLAPSLEVPKVNEHRGHEIESLQYNNEILGIISPYGNSMFMAISQDSVQT